MSGCKKNILLLIPNLGFGGAQRVFHDHSVEFSKKYTVYECVFNIEHGLVYPSGNKLINLQVPAGSTIFLKIYFFILRCIRLRKVKKDYCIDVCVSHLEGADYVNILSKWREKTILCIHGSKLYDLNISGILGWLRKKVFMPFLYNKADMIVTVSQELQQELSSVMRVNASKLQTIYNFFYQESILVKASEKIEDHYAPLFEYNQVIITSGRLARQKNQSELLKIMRVLIRTNPCKLVILGDGELREELLLQAESLSLRTYSSWSNQCFSTDYDVYFFGYQSNPFKYIRKSTIFVLPSAWEGFPMALGEAMICGVPVVATDCPTGPREMIAPANNTTSALNRLAQAQYAEFGILMPMLNEVSFPHTTLLWVDVLVDLLNNPDKQVHYGLKSKEGAADFTSEKIFNQWEKVIG